MIAPRKWEQLKQDAARALYASVLERSHPDLAKILLAVLDLQITHKLPTREALQKLADAVWDKVMAWDVRRADKLLTVAPGFVPGTWFRTVTPEERKAWEACKRDNPRQEDLELAKKVAWLGGSLRPDEDKLGVVRPLTVYKDDTPNGDWMVVPA